MESYLVTGATGYIGSALIRYLMREKPNVRITAIVRTPGKARETLPARIELFQADLTQSDSLDNLNIKFDAVIHCACMTKSNEMIHRPVEVTRSIIGSTQTILEFARKRGVRSVVCLSSMEVYGQIDCPNGHRVQEGEASAGRIELLNMRSCYPLAKRMAENICYCYFREYGVPVKVARLAQTFGRWVLPGESRVFVQFARSVLEGRDIVLHTRGSSVGNYCDIEDAIRGILTILEKGAEGEAYNVVNEGSTMTIREMAEMVCRKLAAGQIKVVYDIPEENVYGYAAETKLRLSGKKLEDLGWKPVKALEEMYRDLCHELKCE